MGNCIGRLRSRLRQSVRAGADAADHGQLESAGNGIKGEFVQLTDLEADHCEVEIAEIKGHIEPTPLGTRDVAVQCEFECAGDTDRGQFAKADIERSTFTFEHKHYGELITGKVNIVSKEIYQKHNLQVSYVVIEWINNNLV